MEFEVFVFGIDQNGFSTICGFCKPDSVKIDRHLYTLQRGIFGDFLVQSQMLKLWQETTFSNSMDA
jgi:hypothetical protein